MAARIDDPTLDVDEDSRDRAAERRPARRARHAGVGQLPIPKKLLKQGVRDMVRISDARMSGTSYGACVLHVAPESLVGGPLALVRDGDLIELDVAARKLELQVSDAELARRRAAWKRRRRSYARGFGALYLAARHAGRRGLRFRFPRRHRARARPGNPPSDPRRRALLAGFAVPCGLDEERLVGKLVRVTAGA